MNPATIINPLAVALAEVFGEGVSKLVDLSASVLKGAYTSGLSPEEIMTQLNAGLAELQQKVAARAVQVAANNAEADAEAAKKPSAAAPPPRPSPPSGAG